MHAVCDAMQDSFMTKLTVAAQEAIISQDHVWTRLGVELPTGITTDINVSNVGLYNWQTKYDSVSHSLSLCFSVSLPLYLTVSLSVSLFLSLPLSFFLSFFLSFSFSFAFSFSFVSDFMCCTPMHLVSGHMKPIHACG